jgi:hypothetical protein
MKDGVPNTMPARVRVASTSLAIPKSVSFKVFEGESYIIFAGLISL